MRCPKCGGGLYLNDKDDGSRYCVYGTSIWSDIRGESHVFEVKE